MIIISSKPGQLGNMLFLFSAFISNAMQNKYKVLNPAFEEYAKYFPNTSKDFFCRYPPQKTWFTSKWMRSIFYTFTFYLARLVDKVPIKIPFIDTIHLDWEQSLNLNSDTFVQKANKSIIFVQGWQFRDEVNLKKYAEEIKLFFVPKEQHLKNAETVIKDAREKGDLVIGIHIRRGDYKTFEGGKYFYSLAEYKIVMQKTIALFQNKNIVFLICSNEKLDSSDFNGFNYSFGTKNEIEDLYSFALCDYLIGPPSTYTMWASFYSQIPFYMIKNIDTIFHLSDFDIKT